MTYIHELLILYMICEVGCDKNFAAVTQNVENLNRLTNFNINGIFSTVFKILSNRLEMYNTHMFFNLHLSSLTSDFENC